MYYVFLIKMLPYLCCKFDKNSVETEKFPRACVCSELVIDNVGNTSRACIKLTN